MTGRTTAAYAAIVESECTLWPHWHDPVRNGHGPTEPGYVQYGIPSDVTYSKLIIDVDPDVD